MIKVEVITKNNNIKTVTISGHALYDDYGKDIVCAAVSSTVITTINGINMINDTIDYHADQDVLLIKVVKDNDVTYKLLENMINNLQQLANDYKKNIKIVIKEG